MVLKTSGIWIGESYCSAGASVISSQSTLARQGVNAGRLDGVLDFLYGTETTAIIFPIAIDLYQFVPDDQHMI